MGTLAVGYLIFLLQTLCAQVRFDHRAPSWLAGGEDLLLGEDGAVFVVLMQCCSFRARTVLIL